MFNFNLMTQTYMHFIQGRQCFRQTMRSSDLRNLQNIDDFRRKKNYFLFYNTPRAKPYFKFFNYPKAR